MPKISGLSDYPAIKKLASALHQFDANQHGAAIMIGAGFSRSAAWHVSGEKKMPLWKEFTEKLIMELNPNDKDLSFSDPLRVAEEYSAYFGPAALNNRIRYEIDDDAWRTGDLYKSLLELPWSEVMTTNWDTLLAASVGGSAARMACKSASLKSSILKTCRSRRFKRWYSSTERITTRSRPLRVIATGSVRATS